MSELELIAAALKRASRRHLVHAVWNAFWRGLLVAGAIWLVAYGTFKLFPLPRWVIPAAPALGLLVLLVMVFAATLRRKSLLQVAQWVDQRQQSKDRLSTAWELSAQPTPHAWQQFVLKDAAVHAQSLNPHQLLPLRWPRVSRWALLVLALGVGLGFVPEYRTQAHIKRQQEVQRVRDTGRRLSEFTRRQLAQRPPELEPVRKAIEATADFGQELARANLSRADAMRELASMRQQLAEQNKQLGQTPAVKALERAAKEGAGEGSQANQALQKAIEDLQKRLGKGADQGEKLDQLRNQLQQAQEGLMGAEQKSGAAAQAARAQIARELAQVSQEISDLGTSLAGLEDAIKALRMNQADKALKDLQAAVSDMDKMREMAKKLKQMQQQASRAGKDLAEQLRFGQAQAAQQRLKQMIQQLQDGAIDPETLKKLLDEVSKAVEPGKQYGDVGEHLNRAVGELQKNQSAAAGQSLKNAADALQKLLQEMQDAESLMATMGALDQAQLALAMGLSWDQLQSGECKQCNGAGCSACQGKKPGFGPGGKPGSGVGTWADETGWNQTPQETAGWDNSGVERPDMDARGRTDRADSKNPNLAPTKVQGQMSPGGPMPSITLKGVSIKGQSTVQYEAAAAAAQAEAESALNQDQVPRAYQNTVRDYFDDLRK